MFFVIFCDFYELQSILVGECWPSSLRCVIDEIKELNVTLMLTPSTHKVLSAGGKSPIRSSLIK